MSEPVKPDLLTSDEIAAMRRNIDVAGRDTVRPIWLRVIATLEALLQERDGFRGGLARTRDDLIDAQGERDTWRAEAEDQRAAVARLEAERDRLLTETDALRAKLARANGLIAELNIAERKRAQQVEP